IMREMGRRFQDLGLLDDAQDIFYLELDEILALVEGRSTCTNVRALAAIRGEEFARYAETPAPDDRFETRGLVYSGNTFRQVATPRHGGGDRPGATSESGGARGEREGGPCEPSLGSGGQADVEERSGLGCCPGVVRGQVRVVLDPRNVTLERQTILVA